MLAYFIRKFPQLSETFIANEIVELERLGIRPLIFSYKRPTEDVHHECVRLIRSPVTYLPDPLYRHPVQIYRAHRKVRRADPERYRATLRHVLINARFGGIFRAWREFVRAGQLACLIRDGGITHIHVHMAHTATQVAMLVGMMTGVPYSFTAHAYDIFTEKTAHLKKRIEAAKFVVTVTQSNVDYLRRLVGSELGRKVHLQYLGVDLEKFSLRSRKAVADPPMILGVGRLVGKKGFADLLQACALLAERGESFRCMIVGEGPERKSLTKMIKRLRLENVVQLAGALSQEELLEIYRRATVSALPCRIMNDGNRDGLPVALMEAMALGIPVVSTTVSGIPELIADGENGLLVAERDVEALASALSRLLAEPDLRANLASNALATISEHFDSRANARSLASFLVEPGSAPSVQTEPQVLVADKAVAS